LDGSIGTSDIGGYPKCFDDGTHPGRPWCCLRRGLLT